MSLYLMRFWDGQPLRYTLKKKNATTDQELFVIVFTLVPEDKLDEYKEKWEGGKGKEGSGAAKSSAAKDGAADEQKKEGGNFQDADVD